MFASRAISNPATSVGVHAQRPDHGQRAGIGRVLQDQVIGAAVDPVQRRRPRARRAVRVGRRHHIGIGRVQRGIHGDVAGVGMDPQVLVGVADHAQPVHHRIEIDAERGAAERSREVGDEGGRSGERIDRIQAIGDRPVGHRIQLAGGGPHVDADHDLACGQTHNRDRRQDRAGGRSLETNQRVIAPAHADQRRVAREEHAEHLRPLGVDEDLQDWAATPAGGTGYPPDPRR